MSTKEMFVRKHIAVEAIQFTGKNFFDVQAFINGRKPEITSNCASQKWDEYCQKCEQNGYLEVPSSLGYDPTYSRCNPTDYIVSPSPGVYTVMSKESFEEQYTPMASTPGWRREDITDVSGVNALAEGYGPLSFKAEPLALMSNEVFAQLETDLIQETERAMRQRDTYKETGVSTAHHGGSHDTCFGAILRRYIHPAEKKVLDSLDSMLSFANVIAVLKNSLETSSITAAMMRRYAEVDVGGRLGVELVKFLSLDEATRERLLGVAGRAVITLKVPEGEIPSEVIEGAIARMRESRQQYFPVGQGWPDDSVQARLDRAAKTLREFLEWQMPLTEEEALKTATHRHYKGGLYYRLFDVLHTETQETLTVYLHVWPHAPGGYGRPQVMFDGKNDDGQTRFEKIR